MRIVGHKHEASEGVKNGEMAANSTWLFNVTAEGEATLPHKPSGLTGIAVGYSGVGIVRHAPPIPHFIVIFLLFLRGCRRCFMTTSL